MQCLIIRQNGHGQNNLEAALRSSHFKPGYQHVSHSAELQQGLKRSPELLFCPDKLGAEQKNRLYSVLYRHAPDCIVVYYSANKWQRLAVTTNNINTCTLTVANPAELYKQLDYLLAYAKLKAEFRHCKHLLRIVEQRNQWLVEYSREAVAYISRNQHLYVNAAYMHLFDFNSELAALNSTVSKLISATDHPAFLALSRETEQKAFLPNKLLLNMKSPKKKGQLFRAEVRFVPAVLHGQRCIQLHVHPLLDLHNNGKKIGKPTAPDPWQVRIKPDPKKSTNRTSGNQKIAPTQVTADTKPLNSLQVHFKELLNLKGSENPAIFMVEPYLKKNGESLNYQQLLARLNSAARRQLDEQCLEAGSRYLLKRFGQPLKCMTWVALGEWIFTDKQGLEKLLKFLNRNSQINLTFVISINAEHCIRFREIAIKIFPLLRATGIRIALDNVRKLTPEISALLTISEATLLRTHPDMLEQADTSGGFSDELQTLLQLTTPDIVIDGVKNINTMNALCDSNAAYLQGEVLEKFTR